jgi:hypothetical protein
MGAAGLKTCKYRTMKRFHNELWIALIAIFMFPVANAQTLQDQFKTFYEESSNWEDYKVVKVNEMNRFWGVVSDSLNKKDATIRDARVRIDNLESKIDELTVQVAETQTKLDESNKLNDSIFFLGIPFSKTAYHIMVWLIILGVLVLTGSIFLMFKSSNKTTRNTLKEYEDLKREFDVYREDSKQKQIMMKRDIQTMLNTLEEHNIKVTSMVGYRDSIKF